MSMAAINSVTTVPDQSEWIKLDEAARILNKNPGTLRRMCAVWAGNGRARLVRERGKRPYWQVRGILTGNHAHPAGPAIPSEPAHLRFAGDDLRGIPKEARDQVLQRRQLLIDWEKAIAAAFQLGFNREQATAQFLLLHHSGGGLSRRTLYRWAEGWKAMGFAGLMDARKSRDDLDDHDPFFAEVRRLWMRPGKPKLSVCYQMAVMTAQDQGWKICSYRNIAYKIKSLAPAQVIRRREGESAFTDKAAPFIERDYSALRANEMWNADHHICDVVVVLNTRINRQTGEIEPVYGRPWLTCWQDLASRKIVGWAIRATDPNTDVILDTLRLACESHGVPEAAYTDNGKDFDAASLTGETKAMRWKRRKVRVQVDEPRLTGVYASLGIRHIHAQPFHGQSKPVERFFRTLEDRFGRLFDTYCGNKTQEKPEDLQEKIAAGKAPTLEKFIEQFRGWLESDYHNRIHTGDSMGVTPNQAFEAKLTTKRTAPKELLEVMCQKRIGPVKVTQNGVRHQGLYYGQFDLELSKLLGQQVYLRVDDRNISTVSVWSMDDKLICVAPANHRLPANADSQAIRQAMAEKRRHRRLFLDAQDAAQRRHENLPERMIRAAQERAQIQQKLAEDAADQPTLKPVRSQLEGQLNELQTAQTQTRLRKAVGDDTAPPARFSYQPSSSIDFGTDSRRFEYQRTQQPESES